MGISTSIYSKLYSSVSEKVFSQVFDLITPVVPNPVPSPDKNFNFTSQTMDGDFTFTRAAAATRLNSAGKWETVASGQPRWHYLPGFIDAGLLIEPNVTNRVVDFNANPTTTTGWTKGGDAASVFSVVSDPSTLISTAKLELLCTTGKVYKLDNSLGVTTAYVDSGGTFGVTTESTVSAWLSGGTGSLTRTGTGTPEVLSFPASSSLVRRALSTTPSAVGDTFRIVADAGQIIYFILAQMEALAFKEWYDNGTQYTFRAIPTSPIITTGAIFNRPNDLPTISSLNGKSYFDENNFTISVEYVPLGYAASQHIWNISSGAASNFYASEIRAAGTSGGYLRPRVTGSSVADTNQDLIVLGKPLIGKKNRVAFSASPTQFANVSPVIEFPLCTMPFLSRPTGVTTLRLGANAVGSSNQLFGVIRNLSVWKTAYSSERMGSLVLTSTQNVIAYSGQSLAASNFYSYETTHNNTGELKGIQTMDSYYPTSENILMNMARDGSMLLLGEYTNGLPYFFDDGGTAGGFVAWGDAGLRLLQQLDMTVNAGTIIKGLIWDQGQGGVGTVGKARHKAGLVTLHRKMAERVGYWFPMLFQPLSQYSDAQGIREAYQELGADPTYPHMYCGPEVIDQELLPDNTHPTSAGMYISTPRSIRKMMSILGKTVTGGVDGPKMASASRSGTTVTLTITPETGTDFTPTTGITGFIYQDGSGNNVVLSNVNRASATTITMTLASAVPGKLYNIYGSSIVDRTKYTKDNSTNGLLLRGGQLTVS